MLKCPFCQYDNEDGALFCEQCKSDLGVMEAVPMAQPVAGAADAAAEAMALASPGDEGAPMAFAPEPPIDASPAELAEHASAGPPTNADAAEPTIPMAAPVDDTEAPPFATPVSEGVPLAEAVAPAAGGVPSSAPAAAVPDAEKLPPGTQPKLVVLRGIKIGVEYPLYDGLNFIGRADEKPVDIDLDDQEPPDRVLSSRQHALITFADDQLVIEDLNSANGTFVNRTRVYPSQKRALRLNDVIQIGNVQMKVKG